MRHCLFLMLGVLAGAPAVHAQPSEPSSLAAAEASLIDVLAHHDSPGFEHLLSPDTLFTVPLAHHGVEEVLRAWSPFLIPNGGTVAMTANAPIVATSGELGYVTGTMILKNPAGATMQTVEYVAVWRLMAGSWKLAVLSGGNSTTEVRTGGLGGYRFGMSPDQVRNVLDCQPYTNVSQTGGMECANYAFDGRKINVSFLFSAGRLRRVQLWYYEGTSDTDAKEAVAHVIAQLRQVGGGVSIASAPGRDVTPELVMETLRSGPPDAQGTMQFDIATPAGPQPEMWFGRVARRQGGYFVMLFVDPRVAR